MTLLSFHLSAKPSYKSIVVDESRRKNYDSSEEQLPLEPDPVLDVFSAEPKELINVCLFVICYWIFVNNFFFIHISSTG